MAAHHSLSLFDLSIVIFQNGQTGVSIIKLDGLACRLIPLSISCHVDLWIDKS